MLVLYDYIFCRISRNIFIKKRKLYIFWTPPHIDANVYKYLYLYLIIKRYIFVWFTFLFPYVVINRVRATSNARYSDLTLQKYTVLFYKKKKKNYYYSYVQKNNLSHLLKRIFHKIFFIILRKRMNYYYCYSNFFYLNGIISN